MTLYFLFKSKTLFLLLVNFLKLLKILTLFYVIGCRVIVVHFSVLIVN